MTKIKELIPVENEIKPFDCYELVLTFSAKNHDDSEESFFFKTLDDLFKSVELLLEYFNVHYNSRCGSTLIEVVLDKRKQELQEIDKLPYDDRTEYQDFFVFLEEDWPHTPDCWIPKMLDSFEVYYYDASNSKFKVVLE